MRPFESTSFSTTPFTAKAALAALTILAAPLTATRPAAAQADSYRWCAEYGGPGGGGINCYFRTLAQCRAAISGVGGICRPNGFYTGRDRPRPRSRQRR